MDKGGKKKDKKTINETTKKPARKPSIQNIVINQDKLVGFFPS